MATLSEILSKKLIPWTQQDASEHFIVARPKMRQAEMPYGVQLSPHKIQSKRVIVKKGRCYNQVRNVIAEWPDEGLQELGKFLLVCVLDGFVDYPVGNYKFQSGPGQFIFIPPGVPCPDGSRTYVALEKSTFCEMITFLLHPNALELWLSHGHAQGRDQSDNCLILHERLVSVFRAMMEEVMSGEAKSLQLGAQLLHVFFGLLEREINEGRFQSYRTAYSSTTVIKTSSSSDFLAHLESYVQTRLRDSLTLEVVSAEMYLSPAQFARVIRRETGQSFNEFLAERRMEEAKKLLLNSKWSTSVVASFVGIKSPSYFCTFFKRHAGMSPAEYRARGMR
jgi:AraC-like DNA-binding protein